MYMARAYGRVHSLYTAMGGHVQTVHAGRVQTVYTVYTVYTAVYKLCTRPYTGHAHGPSVTVYTAVFTVV